MVKDFGEYWDDLGRDTAAKGRADKVLRFIRKFAPHSRSVLELGVGTGKVLRNFPKSFNLYGLDPNKKYVDLARKKIPEGYFWAAGMHNFNIVEKFDVIFSIYDSINFLKDFSQWASTFKNVSDKLEDDGIFVFDMYTPIMLKKALTWNNFTKEKFGFMWDKGEVKGNNLTWHISIFEKIKGNSYQMNEYFFHEKIWPVHQVEKELCKHFVILEKIDGETLKRPTEETYRLLYAVKKRKNHQ